MSHSKNQQQEMLQIIHYFILLISTLLLLLILTSAAVAQINRIEQGDKIKVSVPSVDRRSIVGIVSEVSPSFVKLTVKDSTLFIYPSSIKKLAVSNGQKRNTFKGALIGMGSGALIGGIIGAATYKECTEEGFLACLGQFESRSDAFLVGSVLGAVPGLLLGGIIGYGTKTERWERVPVQISVAPVPSGKNKLRLHPKVTLRLSLNRK